MLYPINHIQASNMCTVKKNYEIYKHIPTSFNSGGSPDKLAKVAHFMFVFVAYIPVHTIAGFPVCSNKIHPTAVIFVSWTFA